MLISYRFCICDSLEKIFPQNKPISTEPQNHIMIARGETYSFQIAYRIDYAGTDLITDAINFDVITKADATVTLRKVDLVPSHFPCNAESDDDYITHEPGLFPDLLSQMPTDGVRPAFRQWRAVWVDICLSEQCPAGDYEIQVSASKDGDRLWMGKIEMHVIAKKLNYQSLIHTEFFHPDAITNYYHVPALSDEFWLIASNFIRTAVEHGINMVLTPIFTPPLDTAVGGERTTVQLVNVKLTAGKYTFDFENPHKWIQMCKACGVTYYEMIPLFSNGERNFHPK